MSNGAIMKRFFIWTASFVLVLSAQASVCATVTLPELVDYEGSTRLLVDGKPYLILGGELGNSTASDMDYMENVWPRLKAMNLNTVLAPVYWELIEPQEGQYDFSLVKALIDRARKEELNLVLLWFGSWKNSMSSYTPGWVKRDLERFPRAVDDKGVGQEILTPFNINNMEADKKIFSELMLFLKSYDQKKHTVIMVQVENEIGMLPSARDHHPEANKKYSAAVPQVLIAYLKKNKASLAPEIKAAWQRNSFREGGTWEEVFGKSVQTEELFMAWYFGVYTNEIAQAGKDIYPLPLFVNAALNHRPGKKPGEYPSAGPLPHTMDVWKASTPAIDLYAPDFYNPNFKHWSDLYTRNNQALFIPEIRFTPDVATKALYAFGRYNCIGFSPFAIESIDEVATHPLGKSYRLIANIAPLILANQGSAKMDAVKLSKESSQAVLKFGDYIVTAKHDYTLGWSPDAKNEVWPETAAIILHVEGDEFYFAGTGVVFTFDVEGKTRAGIEKIDEGQFVNGEFKARRRLNGDQSHQGRHLRIEMGSYDIQKIKLYQYE